MRLKYTRISDGCNVVRTTGSFYYGNKISNAIPRGTFLVGGRCIFYVDEEEIECWIRDHDFLKAVYVTYAENLIGVYEDGEGYLNFYRLKNHNNKFLEKDDDSIRRIKNIFSWDNVKKIFSEDSGLPWMILRHDSRGLIPFEVRFSRKRVF